MKKIILTLLLATTSLSFADVFKDACNDFDQQALKNNKLTVLDYAEELSKRVNQARTAKKQDEADRLLKLFTVTVSTGLKFGINKNPTPDLVGRLEKAVDSTYMPLKGVSSQDLAKSLDDAYESSRIQGTLDQYAAVVEHSYHAVGLHVIKPWADVPNIDQIKTKKPSQIFTSTIFEKKEDKQKPTPASPKPSALPKPEAKTAPASSKPSASSKPASKEASFKGETTYRPLKYLKLVEQEKRGNFGQVTNEDDIEKYKKLQDAFQKGKYPYKHLEEDLEAVKGLQEINIDSLMGDEVITDLIAFYQDKPDNDKRLAALMKELAGFDDIIKTKGLAYGHHKPKIEELQQKIKEGSKYKDGITYLKESGSSNFNKGVEALLKVINYKGYISVESKYIVGKWILGNKVLNLSSSVTKDVNLKKSISNIFSDRLHSKRIVNNELAQVLFKEGILAVQKINVSTEASSLAVDIGSHFTLQEHGENDVYLEFSGGRMGRLTASGGAHFYPSTGLKLSAQEQESLEAVKKDSSGH